MPGHRSPDACAADDRLPDSPPHAHQFPQLSRGVARGRRATRSCWSGPNGAGKTNLIEAISFLAPGRGLRRATLEEVAFSEGDGSWAVAAEIEGALGLATLGTGIERRRRGRRRRRAQCRIDREPVASAAAFADHLRVVWLVPAMDTLFAGAPSERRRFLDRLALAVDAEHASRVNALERSLRSRNRLLEEARPMRTGSTRSNTKPPNSRSRSRDARWRRCAGSQTVLAGRTECGLSAGRDRARRLDGDSSSRRIRRSRSRSATARCCATIAPATPPPAARSTGRI